MKKFLALALALAMVLSLAACGGGGGGGGGGGSGNGGNGENSPADSAEPSEPSEDYDARFELFVNGEDDWTPFPGKSGVTFECSKADILAVRPGPSKVEFTGKQVGTVVITATLDGQEAKAFVKVKRMVAKEEDGQPVPLILDLPGSYYMEYRRAESEHITTTCLTSGSHANKYFDEDEARYGWNIDYFTPSSNYIYWEGYGWMDTTEDGGWTSGKFTNWLTEGENPIFYDDLTIFRQVMLADGTFASEDISRFDTGETETIADAECKIYEYHSMKYWVEPIYHFCLKYSGDGENDFFTVTRFEAPFEEENPIAPSADDVIHQP